MNNMEIDSRTITEQGLIRELNTIKNCYMQIWDEYYKTRSRESAFLKDLVDSLMGISAILEVYTRDGYIYPDYALEKLNNSKSYIESNIAFFEKKLKELEKQECDKDGK